MNMKESNKLDMLGQNTPIYQYPMMINKNFSNIENEISFFYNDRNKTFTDKRSGRCIIAPIYNEKVQSNIGIFDDLTVDNLKIIKNVIISNPNGQDVTLDSIVLKQNLNSSNFIIDDVTGIISIRKSEEESVKCPIEADNIGNVVIGVGALLPTANTCNDNISIGNNLTLSSIGKIDKTKALSDNNSYNIAIGAESLKSLREGTGNIVFGATSGTHITTGSGNIILGTGICNNIDVTQNKLYIGNSNSGVFIEGDMANGELSLPNNNASIKFFNDIIITSNNSGNVVIGKNDILNMSFLTGNDNVLIGSDISATLTGGEKNIFIGSNSAYRLFDISNYSLCIGVVDVENGIEEPIISGDMRMGHISFNANVSEFKGDIRVSENFRTSGSGTAIGLDANNNIVKFTSSKRYKTNIKRLKNTDSKGIYNIECITYEPIERDGNEYLGFIAEDVEKIDRRLVGYTNINGVETVDSVLYERFVVHLLNEVQQHEETIKELKDKVAELTKKIK